MRSQILPSRKPSLANKIGWVVMLLLAILLDLFASRYLTLNPDVYFPEQRMVYMAHITILIVHIVASMLTAIIGPFQFLPGIRKGRWLKLHRWLGRTYLLGILFGGLSGLYMAQFAHGGIVSSFGFRSLAILWLFSGFMAYKHIRNKELDQHREWMIRNYALTFAGVMLRLWNPLFGALGVDFTTGYIVVAWLCWVPNLALIDFVIRRNRIYNTRTTTFKTIGLSGQKSETVELK